MPVWNPSAIGTEPVTRLRDWRVVRVLDSGHWHLVGFAVDAREGRVSSPVVSLDQSERRAETKSGRVYLLEGPPGTHADALYVWERWLRLAGSPPWRDDTAAALAAGKPRTPMNGATNQPATKDWLRGWDDVELGMDSLAAAAPPDHSARSSEEVDSAARPEPDQSSGSA
jgi:hypothetical protein